MFDAEGERRERPHGPEPGRTPRAKRQESREEERKGGEVRTGRDSRRRGSRRGSRRTRAPPRLRSSPRPRGRAARRGPRSRRPRAPGSRARRSGAATRRRRRVREERENQEPERPVVVTGGFGVDVSAAGGDLRDDSPARLVVVPVRAPGEPQPEREAGEDSRPDQDRGGRGEATALPRFVTPRLPSRPARRA